MMATKRWLYTLTAAYVVGMVVFALTIAPADASHPISMCLDIEPDRLGATVGTDHTLQAVIGISDSEHPPDTECHTDGFQAGTDTQIDFEITGAGDEDGATPSTPDLSCEVPAGSNSCSIEPPSSGNGDQQIQAWIDQDRDDGTVELDATEGYDEVSMPGDTAEPDATDVALWSWNGGPPSDKRFAVSISIDRTDEGVKGGVTSGKARCVRRRLVVVRRRRPGDDERLGATRTDREGDWSFRLEARGRIYSFVPRLTWTNDYGWRQCVRATSPVIAVR